MVLTIGHLMEGYLGEFPIKVKRSKEQWAMTYIERYGSIDGAHHKTWVLDQIARILKGTPVITTEARWSNGHTEMRFTTGEPSINILNGLLRCVVRMTKKMKNTNMIMMKELHRETFC
jgi:hypothetical protein